VRVPGRIIFLIVSMRTINGMSRLGVLTGTKWANICLVLLSQPYNIKANHSGAARASAMTKCLEAVKM